MINDIPAFAHSLRKVLEQLNAADLELFSVVSGTTVILKLRGQGNYGQDTTGHVIGSTKDDFGLAIGPCIIIP